MKKVLFGLMVTCVSTAAFAQAMAPTDKVAAIVETYVMSSDVDYVGKPTVVKNPQGFEVSVPAGVVKGSGRKNVAAFKFPLLADGKVNESPRYKLQLNKLSEIFPSLEGFVKEKKISYSGLSYIAKLVPALGFMESQEVVVKNLKVPFDDANSSLQVEQLRFWDSARLSSTKMKNTKFKKQKEKKNSRMNRINKNVLERFRMIWNDTEWNRIK